VQVFWAQGGRVSRQVRLNSLDRDS
jgi:hypothetical protein